MKTQQYTISVQSKFLFLFGFGNSLGSVQFIKNVFFNNAYNLDFEQLLRLSRKCKSKGFKIVHNTLDDSSKYMIKW